MTRFGHKLNYVINTFVKHTPVLYLIMSQRCLIKLHLEENFHDFSDESLISDSRSFNDFLLAKSDKLRERRGYDRIKFELHNNASNWAGNLHNTTKYTVKLQNFGHL